MYHVEFLTVAAPAAARWREASNWLGSVISFLVKVGVLFDYTEVVDRPAETWWEWIWTIFGYTYQKSIVTIHCDCFMAGVLTIVSLGLAWSLVGLLYDMAWINIRRIRLFVSWVFGQVRVAASLLERVFHGPASEDDPGPGIIQMPTREIVPESIRQGSDLHPTETPSCQVYLGKRSGDGSIIAYGGGVRVQVPAGEQNYLLTPRHVCTLLSDDSVIFRGDAVRDFDIQSYSVGGKTVARPVYSLDTDLVAIAISPDEFSAVKTKVAKIHPKVPPNTTARIAGPDGQGSLGVLRDKPDLFGYVVYSGSTLPGFSGCAYVGGAGDTVYALHLHGGAANTGYSLRLAYVTLLSVLRVRQEESGEFLERIFREEREVIWVDETYHDLDEVRIRAKGVYHVVPRHHIAKLVGRQDFGNKVQYVDFADYESKNSNRASRVESSSSSIESGQAPIQDLVASIMKTFQDSMKQQPPTSVNSGPKKKKNTGGQTKEQTANAPSKST
nr:hypothetical protein [Solemoviridae sp.]